MNKNGMYETKCPGCGKITWAYAKNKRAELPKVYCENRLCRSKDLDAKRFK